MLVTDRRAARTAARVLVVPAALAALTVATPQAAAHTELNTSSPADGTALAGLPPRLTLVFSDPMSQKYAKVAVTGPDGASVAAGPPQADGTTVTLALKADSPGGRYTVGYRVVSKDGHPVSGSYHFTVKAAATPSSPATPAAGAASPATSKPSAQDVDAESTESAVPLLAAAGVLAAAGITAGVHVRRRRQARHGD